MENFTPLLSLAGGVLIGLAAAGLLLFEGRIAGISGIFGGLLTPREAEVAWRALFVAGLIAGGVVMYAVFPAGFALAVHRRLVTIGLAGVLVGIGTQLGGGCTSGHGVCGNARLSPRSMVATMTFIATGALTVWVAGALLGGAL